MKKRPYPHKPDYAPPPGWLLEEYLEERGVSPEEFARQCDRSPDYITGIIAGETPIDAEIARRFENLLGLKAHIWLGIDADYQQHRAKQAQSEGTAPTVA